MVSAKKEVTTESDCAKEEGAHESDACKCVLFISRSVYVLPTHVKYTETWFGIIGELVLCVYDVVCYHFAY